MTYSKVHTLDFFKMEASFEPGEGFEVVELDTRYGPVQTGIMICYDREFPESARVLMLKGAELILTPNACGLDPLRINQFQTRAWENAVVCAMANYAEGEWYNGHSCAFNANGDEIISLAEDPDFLSTGPGISAISLPFTSPYALQSCQIGLPFSSVLK